MQNPFESGHIKNYVLLYVSVVVIMVLFFIASTLFHDVKDVESKKFTSQNDLQSRELSKSSHVKDDNVTNKFQLLDKAY